MANDKDILVENLKETLKGAQTYLLAGYGTAIFLLLLAMQGKLAAGAKEEDMSIPFVGLSAPTFTAAVVALAICFLSPFVVLIFLRHSKDIQKELVDVDSKKLLNAVLTYPSLLTTRSKFSVVLAAGPGLLLACALLLSFYSSHGFTKAAITGVLFAVPYLILARCVWVERAR